MNLEEIFNSKYQLNNLKVERKTFLNKLDLYTKNQGSWMDTGVDFTSTTRWGHNHNFGEGIYVQGTMENRHIRIMSNFINNGMPKNLSGSKILVIGCYTGGDALLLCALGASVVAIEEVPLYSEVSNWLAESFGADLMVYNISIDSPITKNSFSPDSFDIIYNCGVIYHLRDILTGLKNCNHFLVRNGTMYLETMVCEKEDKNGRPVLEYHGPSIPGYNWFMPSIRAVCEMSSDIGFSCKLIHTEPNSRASFVLKKQKDVII